MLKLNLGAADRHIDGYQSVDLVPPADIIADLTQAWPWPDSSIEEVLAYDVIEHLPNKRQTMNEIWRVLVPGGIARIEVPTTRGAGAHCDPTHVSYWTAGDFEYYERGNFARERFRNSPYYAIKADFQIVSIFQSSYANAFGETVWKASVVLKAVK